jgi:hypothetical protein
MTHEKKESEIVFEEIRRSEHLSLEELWEREKELRGDISEALERLSTVRTLMHERPPVAPPARTPSPFCAHAHCTQAPVEGKAYCEKHGGPFS